MILWIVTQTVEVSDAEGYDEDTEIESVVGAYVSQEEAGRVAMQAHTATNDPSLKTDIVRASVDLGKARRYLRISYL